MRVSTNVYVLNKRGEPLMPCSPRKARVLIKENKAKVIKNYPFVIQLTESTGEQMQECSLGIDSGAKNVGFSVITDKKEIVSGTLILDQRASERLTEKRMYRRNRRNRLWYRKPRFNNRNRQEGWLPPSVQRRFNTHVSLINKLKKIIPIKRVTVEVGNFDIQKINNPEIEGVGYQRGDLFGYRNIKNFLMHRENGKCQLCGKESSKDNKFHIHHIILRKDGGTNSQKNLALLHEKCHKKLHKQNLYNLLKKNKIYKEATFMNIIKSKFQEFGFNLVYGYETFVKRNILGLEKAHYNDAFVIADGNIQERINPIEIEQKRRNNRILQTNRKGFIPSIRRKRYTIQNRDFVWIKGKMCLCGGIASKGYSVYVFDKKKIKSVISSKTIEKVYHTGNLVW